MTGRRRRRWWHDPDPDPNYTAFAWMFSLCFVAITVAFLIAGIR